MKRPVTGGTGDPVLPQLRDLRDSIDNIDAAIVHMLAERFRCTDRVGQLKARHGLLPVDPEREAEQVARLRHLAALSKLDPDFAEKFLRFVVREVIRRHGSFPRCSIPPVASCAGYTDGPDSPRGSTGSIS